MFIVEYAARRITNTQRILIYIGFGLYALVRWYYFRYKPSKQEDKVNDEE
jgi:hypothetical protein